jgi:hypothetical protein
MPFGKEKSMKKVKIFIILAIFLITIPAFVSLAEASDVTLIWNANTEPDIAGYKAYQSKISGQYDNNCIVYDGINTTCEITDLPDGTYYFSVSAYDTSGLESDLLNEITTDINAKPCDVQGLTIPENGIKTDNIYCPCL